MEKWGAFDHLLPTTLVRAKLPPEGYAVAEHMTPNTEQMKSTVAHYHLYS